MSDILERLKDPLTYVGLASFGSVFGIKELAMLGVPEVATSFVALAGIVGALFGPTTKERKAKKREGG